MGLSAVLVRITRSAVLEVLELDFVKFLRAKGLRERLVIYQHVLRNASIPIVTVIGLQFGYLLGGAVIVEEVFSLPGWAGLSSVIRWNATIRLFRRECWSSPSSSSWSI